MLQYLPSDEMALFIGSTFIGVEDEGHIANGMQALPVRVKR
jgi:hypothetical protein